DTPNLDEFLADYGIKLGEGVVCETYESNYYNQQFVTVASDISDKFRQDMAESNPKLLIQASRPVDVLYKEKNKIATEAYVKSTEDAYVADLETGNSIKNGQQNYIVVSSKVNNDSQYSNIIVAGSEFMFNDRYLQYTQYQNREYFLSLLNGITHKTDGVVIEPKVISGNVYDITAKQKTVLKWVFICVIPVIVLVFGMVVWLKRKNR
ncbi:MAG: ABC transporter, partial [Oscillospiraceae bacterium]